LDEDDILSQTQTGESHAKDPKVWKMGQMETRKTTCEILLKRHDRKSVLDRIVTGDGKWIYFENPKPIKKKKKNYGLIQDNHQM